MTDLPATVDGIALRPPPGWRRTDPPPGTVVALVEDRPAGEPAATAVVSREDVPVGEHELDRWCDAAHHGLAERFPRLRLLDLEETTVARRPARRLLAHYPAAPTGGHVLEQWLVPDADRGIVLTATAPALAYDDTTAATFADLAASLTAGDES